MEHWSQFEDRQPDRRHTAPQPTPVMTNYGPCAQDEVIEDLLGDGTILSEAVAKDVVERKQMGLEKYGTVLRPLNGRDALVDVYQEFIDAMQYAKVGLMELEFGAYALSPSLEARRVALSMAYSSAKANAKAIKAALL